MLNIEQRVCGHFPSAFGVVCIFCPNVGWSAQGALWQTDEQVEGFPVMMDVGFVQVANKGGIGLMGGGRWDRGIGVRAGVASPEADDMDCGVGVGVGVD